MSLAVATPVAPHPNNPHVRPESSRPGVRTQPPSRVATSWPGTLRSKAKASPRVNSPTLALMKPDAIVINVGRGEVINEADLMGALKAKTIAGAALDVRAQEPPSKGEMESISNLILTPHVAGITSQSQLRINEILTSNIALVLNSKPATHAVGSLKESGN